MNRRHIMAAMFTVGGVLCWENESDRRSECRGQGHKIGDRHTIGG
jgi:hypothetical protein